MDVSESKMEITSFTCRLCLQDEDKMLNLISRCDDGISFSDKVLTVLNIKLESVSNSLKLVCVKCFENVCDFYTYYQQVHENNNHLESIQAIDTNEENVDKFDSVENLDHIYCEIETYGSPSKSSSESADIVEDLIIKPGKKKSFSPSTKSNNCIRNSNNLKIELPEHLKKRISKANGDAKIREFVDLTCTICNKDNLHFNTFKEMQMHYEKAHKTRGYITCCGKKIYRKDRAMDHITIHTDPNAFKCPTCGHNSKSRVLLRIHMKQHLPSEEWPFQCATCNQRFVLRSQLTNHAVTHLNDKQKKFVCDECGKVFALKFVLIKHKLTHSKEKNFFCENCGKSFGTQTCLATHVKQCHSDTASNSRVQCNTCGLWYKNTQTLRTHERRHRDTRNHVCKICSKQCSSKSSLSAHLRYVHMKASRWQCGVCNKQFRRKPELNEHMARHTGHALYMCLYCPKTFFSSSNYFAHRKKRHPDEHDQIKKLKSNLLKGNLTKH